jgi:heme/copper-type cytochrome/quinol oxidase subunit 2
MLAAHLHRDQHLQPIHIKIVKEAEVMSVEVMDMVVIEEVTIPEVVAIAMVVWKFRKRTIETVSTYIHGHKMLRISKTTI